jgi:hypothetical protein
MSQVEQFSRKCALEGFYLWNDAARITSFSAITGGDTL